MNELIKQLQQPFSVIGVIVILASLATSTDIIGFSIDPEKWIAGIVIGFVFIGISIYRNRGET